MTNAYGRGPYGPAPSTASGGGGGPANTDALAEGVTNLYATSARTLATVLAGFSTATATSVTAADSILVALGKIQGQLNAGGGGGIVTSITATAPIVKTGTAAVPILTIPAAASGVSGHLTATDWATFNGKQAALGFTPYNATNPNGYTTNLGTVTSVAALTLNTAGTDVSSSLATGTTTPVITLSLPSASATARGLLTAADWTTFNGKQAALGFTPYNATNPAGYTSNGGTVLSVAALTLGTAGTDVSSSVATSTTTPVVTLNIPTASATSRGALSASDWSVFNGKQAALGFTPYNASNPAGYITAAGLGTVTSVSGSGVDAGTDLAVSVTLATTTPAVTVSIPNASASVTRGLLTGTDYATIMAGLGGGGGGGTVDLVARDMASPLSLQHYYPGSGYALWSIAGLPSNFATWLHFSTENGGYPELHTGTGPIQIVLSDATSLGAALGEKVSLAFIVAYDNLAVGLGGVGYQLCIANISRGNWVTNAGTITTHTTSYKESDILCGYAFTTASFAVIGYAEIVYDTAGNWANGPTILDTFLAPPPGAITHVVDDNPQFIVEVDGTFLTLSVTLLPGIVTFPNARQYGFSGNTTSAPKIIPVRAPIILAVPSTAMLGLTANDPATFVVLAVLVNDIIELAIMNIASGIRLVEGEQLVGVRAIDLNVTATASIAATGIMTVTSATISGDSSFHVGCQIKGTGVPEGTYITRLISGTGSTGTYRVNTSTVVASTAITGRAGRGIYANYGFAARSIASAPFMILGSFQIFQFASTGWTAIPFNGSIRNVPSYLQGIDRFSTQDLYNQTTSRAVGTPVRNPNGNMILNVVGTMSIAGAKIQLMIDNEMVTTSIGAAAIGGGVAIHGAIIPRGATYIITVSSGVFTKTLWTEIGAAF